MVNTFMQQFCGVLEIKFINKQRMIRSKQSDVYTSLGKDYQAL